MLDDALHNPCVQDMDVDQAMAEEEDQAMAEVAVDQAMAEVAVDQAMAEDVAEMDLLEINTKEEAVHAHHMEDKTGIAKRSGNLTLKDKD